MKTDPQVEARVVALIARGDSYSQIQEELAKDDIEISTVTIGNIKQRNSAALETIKGALVQQEIGVANRIMHKSRKLIEDRLTDDESTKELLSDALRARINGDIDKDEYESIVKKISPQISLKDLTTISKEFFNQSQIEQGKPTSITESPAQAKENLKTLLEAINKGDEAAIVKAIFLE